MVRVSVPTQNRRVVQDGLLRQVDLAPEPGHYHGPTCLFAGDKAPGHIPQMEADLVAGVYELDAPSGETMVAVKVTDMLGEEVLKVLVI